MTTLKNGFRAGVELHIKPVFTSKTDRKNVIPAIHVRSLLVKSMEAYVKRTAATVKALDDFSSVYQPKSGEKNAGINQAEYSHKSRAQDRRQSELLSRAS